jgi:hypothetical protein
MLDNVMAGKPAYVVHNTVHAAVLLTLGADICQAGSGYEPVTITVQENGQERMSWAFEAEQSALFNRILGWFVGPADAPCPEKLDPNVFEELRQIRAGLENPHIQNAFANLGTLQVIIGRARREGVRRCQVQGADKVLIFTENLNPVTRKELEDEFNGE